MSTARASKIEFHPTPSALKTAAVVTGGGALLGGLFWGVKGAVILGVGAPVAVFGLVVYLMKGMQ